jgi:hypothetical protein
MLITWRKVVECEFHVGVGQKEWLKNVIQLIFTFLVMCLKNNSNNFNQLLWNIDVFELY